MAEILVMARDGARNADPEKDRRGGYKRGMPVVVMEDGHEWGREEGLPTFVVLKLPGVSAARVRKYLDPETDAARAVVRRRLWQIQWSELPAPARQRLAQTGALTIKADPDYAGPYDYTWAQVKGFFLNHATGLRETAAAPTAG